MSAPSTSLSLSLDALLSQPSPRSPPSSPSNGSGRAPLCLNLSFPLLPSLSHTPPWRPLRGPIHHSLRPADPSSSFPTFQPARTPSPLGAFLGPGALDKLQTLDGFRYARVLPRGSLEVRAMAPAEVRATVELLASSFADAMWIPGGYVRFLEFLVEQYVVQKRAQRPHAATLVAYYRESGEGVELAEFAGTAEVSFNAMGANVSPPSPAPPMDAPYICNMTVRQSLRR